MDDTAACAATRHANQVHAVVERLARRVRADVPALALSPTLWAFLVDPAGAPPPVLPAGAWLVDRGAYLPLPPSVTAEGPYGGSANLTTCCRAWTR